MMRSVRCLRRPQIRQCGFTLVETILAVALSALLLSAVYAAMDQSWRMSASGREDMERIQLARALIARIEQDIRAITFEPPPPSEETEGSITTTTTTATTGTTTDSTAEATEPNSKSIGLRGTLNQMEISVTRPRSDLMSGANAAAMLGGTSDLRTVIYSFGVPGGASGGGLMRAEGERMAVDMIEATGGVASQIVAGQLLAPEIMSLTFRYFDGRVWLETWDAATIGRVPRAVEVQFQLNPPRRKAPLFQDTVSASLNSFRTVILVPISDPFPKEFLE